jgi:hypothetical protein
MRAATFAMLNIKQPTRQQRLLALLQAINELCGVVEEAGYLCTSPLADVSLPQLYSATAVEWKDFTAYVRLLDSKLDHFHVWMVDPAPACAPSPLATRVVCICMCPRDAFMHTRIAIEHVHTPAYICVWRLAVAPSPPTHPRSEGQCLPRHHIW